MRVRIIFLLLAALLAGSAFAQTAVYKWVDKSGNVHYSAVPPSMSLAPSGIVNTATDQAAPPATTAPAATTTQAADKALTIGEPADTPACKTARETLSKYLGATYLYTLGKDGAQQKLSKDQQAQAVAEARNAVNINCSTTGLGQ